MHGRLIRVTWSNQGTIKTGVHVDLCASLEEVVKALAPYINVEKLLQKGPPSIHIEMI